MIHDKVSTFGSDRQMVTTYWSTITHTALIKGEYPTVSSIVLHVRTKSPQQFHQVEMKNLCHCNTLIIFFSHSAVFCCAWDHFAAVWPSFTQTLAVTQLASHLTQECFGIKRSSLNKVPRSCGCKQAWNHHKSNQVKALHHHSWQLVWGVCSYMFVWFSPNVMLYIISKHLHLALCCLKHIDQKVLSFVANLSSCFFLATLPKNAMLVPSFLLYCDEL